MKKVFAVAALFCTVALVSCKKDWTCECTLSDGTNSISSSTTIVDKKKSDAEAECAEGNASGGGYTTTCVLK